MDCDNTLTAKEVIKILTTEKSISDRVAELQCFFEEKASLLFYNFPQIHKCILHSDSSGFFKIKYSGAGIFFQKKKTKFRFFVVFLAEGDYGRVLKVFSVNTLKDFNKVCDIIKKSVETPIKEDIESDPAVCLDLEDFTYWFGREV